jgi:acyl-CoA reductase-like NAD-dependent aldehyde dehydrogenase
MKNDFNDAPPLETLLREQRTAFGRAPFPSWNERAAHLKALRAVLLEHREAIAAAISADFGHRPRQEIEFSELFLPVQEIGGALKHGRSWMKPRRRPMNKWLMPARAKVVPQPLGVIGIIVPWNYPILLAVGPLVDVLAAGNRAMLKMSEYTPRLSALFEQLIGKTFARDHIAVVSGGPDVGAAFAGLPFDHLIFTGSTKVGHAVMRAAADNLTPVTLELGGKSPVIVGPNARFDYAVDSILTGKTFNAGQTCVAPDYILVPRGREQAFIERARASLAKRYPDVARNPDYTTIISPRHFARLTQLADDAAAAGARVHSLSDAKPDLATRRFPPIALTGVTDAMAVMQEEIFGPLLPIVPYDTLDDAIAYVNARPRPLSLYLYDDTRATVDDVMRRTVSGAYTVNETLLHVAVETLPFGGVGPSGMGAYHGFEGFAALSRMKPMMIQPKMNLRHLLAPPYGKLFDALMKVMLRF